MKKTIKLLSVLLLSVILYSCGYVPTEQEQTYMVYGIDKVKLEPVPFSTYPLCKYRIKTDGNLRWENRFTVVDSIGKFDIGDTVYFTLNKVKK